MKKLVIVESPSKSKTIEQYLGSDFIVLSSKGHIRDLAISGVGGLGLDIENNFTPKYDVIKEKKKVVTELTKAAKESNEIYLATDPDREGEAISWHLSEVLDTKSKPTKRVIFNEITKQAVLDAFKEPRDLDINLVSSQETRRILDRIIGFKLSKLLQNKIKSKSAGRVQSATLRIIVEKEREIKAFVKEEFWKVKAIFKDFEADLVKYKGKNITLSNEDETDLLLRKLEENFEVSKVESKERKRDTKLPFTTSSLQQEASNKLFFSSQKTMLLAQKLYEGIQLENETSGLITYMRTDSIRMSNTFSYPTLDFIKKTYGEEYAGTVRRMKKGANVQDAHEAIRPTSVYNTPSRMKKYLTKDELSLYTLIYNRAIASLMKPAKIKGTTLELNNNGALFKATAQEIVFDGYLLVYGQYENIPTSKLPELEVGFRIQPEKVEKTQNFTKPPARYTEARLIKEMEDLGIGRPSTYSQTISTLKKRKYVSLKEKKFTPTEQGELTISKLEEFFDQIISVDYTASMEKILDDISTGSEEQTNIVSKFYEEFIPLVDEANKNMEKIAPKFTGEKCPECGHDMVFRVSKYGTFEACGNFPKCKYIKQKEVVKKEVVSTNVKCTKCGTGEIVERVAKTGKNKGKTFYACNNFPKCKNMLFYKPTGEHCPECGQLLMVDNNGKTICQDTKNCGYNRV